MIVFPVHKCDKLLKVLPPKCVIPLFSIQFYICIFPTQSALYEYKWWWFHSVKVNIKPYVDLQFGHGTKKVKRKLIWNIGYGGKELFSWCKIICCIIYIQRTVFFNISDPVNKHLLMIYLILSWPQLGVIPDLTWLDCYLDHLIIYCP